MEYTKGEWTVHNQDLRNGDTLIIHPPVGENGIYPFYATVGGVEMRKAAHLIASAPLMYEALKDVLGMADSHTLNMMCEPGLTIEQKIQQAISKAEGK